LSITILHFFLAQAMVSSGLTWNVTSSKSKSCDSINFKEYKVYNYLHKFWIIVKILFFERFQILFLVHTFKVKCFTAQFEDTNQKEDYLDSFI
jgi:hypothetical protein